MDVIPEWYRKRIFVALVLEVVGAIVIIFRQEFIISGAQGIPAIEISHNDWAALDEHGRPIVPELTVKTQETTLVLPLGNRQWEALDGLQVQTTKMAFLSATRMVNHWASSHRLTPRKPDFSMLFEQQKTK
jgi:hypothetical protein